MTNKRFYDSMITVSDEYLLVRCLSNIIFEANRGR